MKQLMFFLVLVVAGSTSAQLNFEGNPLTEDTEYTAEESRIYETTAKQEETTENVTDDVVEHSTKLRPVEIEKNSSESSNLKNDAKSREESEHPAKKQTNHHVVPTARHLSPSTYNPATTSANSAELALNTFLNSKTPEESRLSLDHYLQSRGGSRNSLVRGQASQQIGQQIDRQTIADQQQLTQQAATVNQQTMAVSSPVNQHLMQQRQMLQAFPVNQRQQLQLLGPQVYGPVNLQDTHSPVSNVANSPLVQQQQALAQQALQPYGFGIQARSDMFYPVGWQHRVRGIRGKPFSYAQSRGGPGIYAGPRPPVPLKQKGPPVEVIYTKPPGFHRGPPPISNPPVPYEDASAWFPDADHPPSSKDIYYSQLYAQSYDPHYYNYIAKTGKIKPHLYGKLGGKHPEEESNGIWAELYSGFKKHGLKNIMTPTFLLGMTLPVVTLMLTALVQKRSISRSDSREFSREDAIQEYLEQLQRAVECYEKKRRKRDANVGEC